MEQSLDGILMAVANCVDQIDAVFKQVQAWQPGYSSNVLSPTSNLPDTSLKTPDTFKTSTIWSFDGDYVKYPSKFSSSEIECNLF